MIFPTFLFMRRRGLTSSMLVPSTAAAPSIPVRTPEVLGPNEVSGVTVQLTHTGERYHWFIFRDQETGHKEERLIDTEDLRGSHEHFEKVMYKEKVTFRNTVDNLVKSGFLVRKPRSQPGPKS